MALRDWLVRLYPAPWRDRYGEEFDALLEQCLRSPLDVLDILLGAMDAHLALSPIANWRSMNRNNKRRTAILLVFTAYIAFIVAGLSVYGFADDSPFIPMMQTNLGLLLSWRTIQVGAVVALAAVVIGGAPLAWMIVRGAFTSRRKDLRLLLVPVLAFLALVLYVGAVGYLSSRTPLLGPQGLVFGPALLWGLVAVFVLGAIASTIAVWKVVSAADAPRDGLPLPGSTVSLQPYAFAVGPAVLATLAMAAMFVASAAWFWFAFSARPDVLAGNQGPIMTNSLAAMIGTLLLMAVALALALVGLARLRSAPAV